MSSHVNCCRCFLSIYQKNTKKHWIKQGSHPISASMLSKDKIPTRNTGVTMVLTEWFAQKLPCHRKFLACHTRRLSLYCILNSFSTESFGVGCFFQIELAECKHQWISRGNPCFVDEKGSSKHHCVEGLLYVPRSKKHITKKSVENTIPFFFPPRKAMLKHYKKWDVHQKSWI